MAQGLLAGKFSASNRPAQSDNRAHNVLFQGKTFDLALEAVANLEVYALKYGRTTGQVALQWLIQQPGVTSPIVGARTAEQVHGNLQAADFTIEPADLTAIGALAQPVLDSIPDGQSNPWG